MPIVSTSTVGTSTISYTTFSIPPIGITTVRHAAADKRNDTSQHSPMRVICPHCQTIYQLHTVEADAVLICHRCGTEFGMGEMPDDAQQVDTASVSKQQTQDMFAGHMPDDDIPGEPISDEDASGDTTGDNAQEMDESAIESADSAPENDEPDMQPGADDEAAQEVEISGDGVWAESHLNDPDMNDSAADEPADSSQDSEDSYAAPKIYPADKAWQEDGAEQGADDEKDMDALPAGSPPQRAKARIMPWLIAVVLLIAGGGFWMNHDAWLDDPWLRSVLLNAGLDMEIRDKDWHVDPGSVSAIWLERQGGETVLVITAEVHNKLQSDLPPPLIHITLYARDNPDELILERDLIITRPPLMQAIRQAPYSPPSRDNAPIAALGKRGFVLVLEDLPQNAGNFSLQAKAR